MGPAECPDCKAFLDEMNCLYEKLKRAEAVMEVVKALEQDRAKWPHQIVPIATANIWIDKILAAWEEGKA